MEQEARGTKNFRAKGRGADRPLTVAPGYYFSQMGTHGAGPPGPWKRGQGGALNFDSGLQNSLDLACGRCPPHLLPPPPMPFTSDQVSDISLPPGGRTMRPGYCLRNFRKFCNQGREPFFHSLPLGADHLWHCVKNLPHCVAHYRNSCQGKRRPPFSAGSIGERVLGLLEA